jgi:hypothetical protein
MGTAALVIAIALNHGVSESGTMSWSTLALTFATGSLAYFAYRTVRENRELIKHTEQQARAAADLLEEVKTDRELACAPYLTRSRTPHPRTPDTWLDVVQNVGQGPALNSRSCWRTGVLSPGTTNAFHLGAGQQELETRLNETSPAYQAKVIDAVITAHDDPFAWLENVFEGFAPSERETLRAIVCEDRLGNKYRFWDNPKRAKPDVWKARQSGERPSWTRWPDMDDMG